MEPSSLDVYSLGEIARAAGVHPKQTRLLADLGALTLLPSGFVEQQEAARAVRLLREPHRIPSRPDLFGAAPTATRRTGLPFVASGAIHVVVAGAVALLATLGLSTPTVSQPLGLTPVRLVFLAQPGLGGGGGGGGLKQRAPAVQARLKGTSRLRSPVPPRARRSEEPRVAPPKPSPPPEPRAVDQPIPPPAPVPHPDPAPPVVAPVVPVPADPIDRAGVMSESPSESQSRGPGNGGGSGSGTGTGTGEGSGPGIGPGSGGGTGGGPYRPGAGITPPQILREVKPQYTEEARRRNVEGEVVLEVIVQADGSVGRVRVLQGLGSGLDQRAADAVRQWRFSPARRHGSPVDVLVEIAVDFRLR